MRADPGIGKAAAPVGSIEWAQHVRLSMQAAVKEMEKSPERVKRYVDQILEHRGWTLMNKPDGSFFKTWEEFCESPQPWGLGKPWGEMRAVLEAACGKMAVQLGTVPEAMTPKESARKAAEARWNAAPHDDGSHDAAHNAAPHDDGSHVTRAATERLRAINRAPDVVKDAYREGRISQTLAAKLGPKDPKPELAAKVAEIAAEIRPLKDRKQVDRVVRERLGTKQPTAVERIIGMVRKLSQSELYEFEAAFDEFLRGKKA